MYKKILIITLILFRVNDSFSQENKSNEPYPSISGSYTGEVVLHSPDPLVSYRWDTPKATDDLEIYTVTPVSIKSDIPENTVTKDLSLIEVTADCNLMFDFGQVNAAWFEFDSDDLNGEIEMSISEFNEPAVFNLGSQHPVKTTKPVRYGNTWRLELNKELYEGVRFAWIHIHHLNKPATIKSPRLICQIKPTNYEGSFACSDTMLTRIWYTGAYDVKLNLLKDYFGAILMERSDRHSWTGDAHTSQAASMVAFGNYDFVKTNLHYTSTQYNGIASYSLYWVLSLIDYYYYTGDKELLDEMLENACHKLEVAYEHYGTNPNLAFYGWDERLGAGFESSCSEAQNAYKMLSIQTWRAFSGIMKLAGYDELADKYKRYAEEKIELLRKDASWMTSFGVHAAQMLVGAPAEVCFYGSKGWDEGAAFIDKNLQQMPLKIGKYKVSEQYTPFTDVLSDPDYDQGNGERMFINNIGAAWDLYSEDLDDAFFESDMVVFGGTALVPHIHRSLLDLLKTAREKGAVTVVNTAYDFLNEKANPGEAWPLGASLETYHYIDLLITDMEEALCLSGKKTIGEAMSFFKKTGVGAVIVTYGANPLYYFCNSRLFGVSEGNRPVSEKVREMILQHPEQIGDTTGCGDNFAGGVIASIAKQLIERPHQPVNPDEAIALGTASGGYACFYNGGTFYEEYAGQKRELIEPYYQDYLRQTSKPEGSS